MTNHFAFRNTTAELLLHSPTRTVPFRYSHIQIQFHSEAILFKHSSIHKQLYSYFHPFTEWPLPHSDTYQSVLHNPQGTQEKSRGEGHVGLVKASTHTL